jgi:hypothetical protein
MKMKIISIISNVALCMSLAACSNPSAPAPKSAFILVNDDSGALSDPERAKNAKQMMLAQIKDLGTKRRYAKSKFQIISTSFGRTVWVGSVADLKTTRAADVVAKVESHASYCNRLGESFTALRTAVRQLEQQKYTDIHAYYFSSMIATPPPCTDEMKIDLPQLPVPVDYSGLLTASDALNTIAFYYVSPHQLQLYQESLVPVSSWASANGKTFRMYDIEETTYQLRRGLAGVD